MKLPSTLDASHGTRRQLHTLLQWQIQLQQEGINPETVIFRPLVYAVGNPKKPRKNAENQRERDAIETFLRGIGGVIGNEANSAAYQVIVNEPWHQSRGEMREHLTVELPSVSWTCHVFRDGTSECFDTALPRGDDFFS